MKLFSLGWLGLVATCTVSVCAPAAGVAAEVAAPALEDEVDLLTGAFLRGVIVEFDPATHLIIKLAGGELRKVPMSEVRAATRQGRALVIPGQTTPAPTAAPDAPAPAAGLLSPTTGGPGTLAAPTMLAPGSTAGQSSDLGRTLSAIKGPRIRLFATADRVAMLQRRIAEDPAGGSVSYHIVCVLPCKATLPSADTQLYRIGGYRSQPTDWFQLPTTDAQVQANLARDAWKLWPPATLMGGLLFGALGGGMLALHAAADLGPWAKITGFGLAGIGGTFLVTSGVLWLVQPSTRYTMTPGAPPGM